MRNIYILSLLLILVTFLALTPKVSCGEEAALTNTTLDKEYDNLIKALDSFSVSIQSDDEKAVRDLPEVEALSKHGLKVLPFLMGKLQRPEESRLSTSGLFAIREIVHRVTKRVVAPNDLQAWWESGGKDTREKFDALYESWQKEVKKNTDAGQPLLLKTSEEVIDPERWEIVVKSKETDLGRIYRQMRDLGIEILPILLEDIKKGDHTLFVLVSDLTDGAFHMTPPGPPYELETRGFAKWWELNKAAYTIPFPGTTPPAPETPPANDNTAPGGESGGPTPPPPPVLPVEPAAPPAEGGTNPPASGETQP